MAGADSEISVSSELQAVIDRFRSNSKLMLLLCGSSMSFMENQVLGYKVHYMVEEQLNIKLIHLLI